MKVAKCGVTRISSVAAVSDLTVVKKVALLWGFCQILAEGKYTDRHSLATPSEKYPTTGEAKKA
jgi:hypothetical protein